MGRNVARWRGISIGFHSAGPEGGPMKEVSGPLDFGRENLFGI
jgi:hypothetical protein